MINLHCECFLLSLLALACLGLHDAANELMNAAVDRTEAWYQVATVTAAVLVRACSAVGVGFVGARSTVHIVDALSVPATLGETVEGRATEGEQSIQELDHDKMLPSRPVIIQDKARSTDPVEHKATDPTVPEPHKAVKVRSAKADECLTIITTKDVPSLGLSNVLDKFESRARPNQRLVVAFGINNCFTTSQPEICTEFRKKVENLLRGDHTKWTAIGAAARQVVRDELSSAGKTVNMFALIQTVSLKAVLLPLFDLDPTHGRADESIRAMATEINKQWIRSKGEIDPSSPPAWAFEYQGPLREALRRIFDDTSTAWDESDSTTNPLNLILPGYETLWRVVLRCFVELTARNQGRNGIWRAVLRAFVDNTSLEQLDDRTVDGAGVSAADIAKEALRLYPPTRRVYREYVNDEGEVFEVSSDIEGAQRDVSVWGPDALQFKPERWGLLNGKEFEEANFMPFGTRPFACPARRRFGNGMLPFGVSMIAVLVGALLAATDGVWTINDKMPLDGIPLDTDREAYGEWVLERLG